MAQAMGRGDVARRFLARSGNWRNSFDASTGWLRARKADGSFRTPFDPTAINYGSDYTEGNAWQYSWFVPQDQAGLFRLLGGDRSEEHTSELQSLMRISYAVFCLKKKKTTI